MVTIYGNGVSAPCMKVRYVCELLGIDFDWKEMSFKTGELKTPEFKALHPAGKVPVMDDEGFVLFESDAICRYLCTKHESDLYPAELKERALVDQWTSFSNHHVGLALGKVFFNRVLAPEYDLPVDENSLREGIQWMWRYLPILDEQLDGQAHLAGEKISIADISLLCLLDKAEVAQIDLEPYPQVKAWLDRLQAEAFWRAAQGEGAD